VGKRLPSRPAPAACAGLVLTGVAVAVAWVANRVWPTLSPLTAAVVLGVVAANALPSAVRSAARPGVQIAAKRVMRLGIVLLGLQLALGDVLHLGWRTLVFVVAAVFVTFFGTQWIGRRLGLPGRQPLLIATGFAICGASAVAAMEGVTRRPGTPDDDPDPVVAVALVTLCGSLAILVLPLLRVPLGLTPAAFGSWVGASVHDVGQTVATAARVPGALTAAVVVKLTRVVLLAPLVAGVALVRTRRRGTPAVGGRRPPVMPLFVAGFLAAIAVASSGLLPRAVLSVAHGVQEVLLTAALVGLGTGISLPTLRRTGGRALALGLLAWLLVAAVAYAGVRIETA
jgi:uncharacterized integral membrane protein (TIGR00698 family)